MVDRQAKMDLVSEKIEVQFKIIGSTAIEDKLQEEVEEVIQHIKDAKVKIWVLTGDKIETAINIGFSCKLLDDEMEIFVIDAIKTKDILNQLREFNRQSKLVGQSREKAVVVGGETLAKILNSENKNDALVDEYIALTDVATSVLCCRVSPRQKAEVVNLIKDVKKGATTLSIGDGANDVSMIAAANIGIGISGLEGQQAARAADYSIG